MMNKEVIDLSETLKAPEVVVSSESTNTKLLGAHVDEDVYWAFKKAAAMRGETSKEAILHAAYMYMDAAKVEGN